MKLAVPYLTANQMRQVDETAVKMGLEIIQMMENAGYQMADFIRNKYPNKKKILALAGKGGNGGDVLAAARHLINWGYQVTCILSSSAQELKKETKQQYNILTSVRAVVIEYKEKINFERFNLIIDGLLGYSIIGNPRPPFNKLIKRANNSRIPIISFDLPSGMNATTGKVYNPTIKATATLTLALPRTCFQNANAKEYVGGLYLVDIAIPARVYESLGIFPPKDLFSRKSIVKIR